MKTAIKLKGKKNCYGKGGEIQLSDKEKANVQSKGDAQAKTDATREIVGLPSKPSTYHVGTEGWKRDMAARNSAIQNNNASVTPTRNNSTANSDASTSQRTQQAKMNASDSNVKNSNYADSDDAKEKARIQANSRNADGSQGTNAQTALSSGDYAKGGLVGQLKKKSLNRS